jgi:hypothetical protein
VPQESDLSEALDRRIIHAEQRLEVLRELTELGMALARDLTRRALAAPEAPAAEAAPAPRRDPADAFARLSRAIRLTVALEEKSEDQLIALRAGGMAPVAESPAVSEHARKPWNEHAPFPGDHASPRRNAIRDAVFDVVDREVTDLETAYRILENTHDWLAEGKDFDFLVRRSLKDAVTAIFKYFDVPVDLSHWTDDGPPPSTRTARQIWERFWPPPGGPPPGRRLQ